MPNPGASSSSALPPASPRPAFISGPTAAIISSSSARNAGRLAAVAADARTRGAGYVDSAVVDLDRTEHHADLLAHAINSLGGLDVAYLALGVLGDQSEG